MADNVVRELCFINKLQKKKYIFFILMFGLISCAWIVTVIKRSSTMDINHILESVRQENAFNYFDNIKETNFTPLYNVFIKHSTERCFTLFVKTKTLTEAYTKYNYQMTRAVDIENENKTNTEKPVGQTDEMTRGVDIENENKTNTEKLVGQTKDIKLIEKTKTCNRYIILGGTMGRIGNQMFEVAALIGMAFKHDMIPIIEKNILLSKYFNLPNQFEKFHSDMLNVRKCICNKASFYYNCTDEFHSGANVSMHGYLQSWKYFVHAEFVIRSTFKVKDAYLFKAKEYIESICMKGYQLVCLHIRRGDMTTHALYEFGYVLPNMTFIEKAKRFYTNKYDKVQFLVVSEDKNWCRKKLKGLHISPFTDPGVELALLTSCHHMIVTGGTYGWWGAWLAGGSVVYFNGHHRPNSTLDLGTNKADYYPPSWIGMSQNPE